MTTSSRTTVFGREASFDVSEPWLAHWLVVMRLAVGWWFLHAGLDKFAAWPFDASFFVGGIAQESILGPLVTVFSDGILLQFTNVMIPLGQTLIGIGLILGALTRLAAFFGAFLMTFFYFINGQSGDWSHGLVTGDLLGLLIFAMIATLGSGRILGVDAYLAKTDVVDRHPKLQYIIG